MEVTGILLRQLWGGVRKILPGLTVLVIVFLLMRGVNGTIEALKLQIATLTTSLMGTGDGLSGVILQTLPLAIASGVVLFAIRAEWLTFESPWSFVGIAAIILCGASVGGFLRTIITDAPPSSVSSTIVSAPAPSGSLAVGNQQQSLVAERPTSIGPGLKLPDSAGFFDPHRTVRHTLSDLQTANVPHEPVQQSPFQQLSDIDWMAVPDETTTPTGRIPPLDLLPEMNGVAGVVAKAVNQTLGFLVAYKPRMFLAALIAGGWVGWSFHRRIQQIHEQIIGADDKEPARLTTARAA